MAKSNNAFIKKLKAEKKRKKKLEKIEKKNERKKSSKGGSLEEMIAYVDEFGNISSEPPVEKPAVTNKDNNTTKNKTSNTNYQQ